MKNRSLAQMIIRHWFFGCWVLIGLTGCAVEFQKPPVVFSEQQNVPGTVAKLSGGGREFGSPENSQSLQALLHAQLLESVQAKPAPGRATVVAVGPEVSEGTLQLAGPVPPAPPAGKFDGKWSFEIDKPNGCLYTQTVEMALSNGTMRGKFDDLYGTVEFSESVGSNGDFNFHLDYCPLNTNGACGEIRGMVFSGKLNEQTGQGHISDNEFNCDMSITLKRG